MTHFDSQLSDQATQTMSGDTPARAALTAVAPTDCFSTPIWLRQVEAHPTLNPPLIEALKAIEATNKAVKKSNIGGWHSETNLHQHPAFARLSRVIAQVAYRCAQSVDYDFTRGRLVIQSMWANRNGPGDYNTTHVHPNAFLSGSYYLAVPADSGNLEFFDPVRERVMVPYPTTSNRQGTAKRLEVECRPGMLAIFPSWLSHGVQPNRSDEMRYSIAFNITSTAPQLPAK